MIEKHYQELCSLLEQVKNCASQLRQEITEQSEEDKDFSRMFITNDLGKSVGTCLEAVSKAEQNLHQSVDNDMEKLRLKSEYAALRKQRELLQAPDIHLLLLLKKAGANNVDAIMTKLSLGDVKQKVAEYNQSLEKLSYYAVNSDAFRISMVIQKKKTILSDRASIAMGNIIKFGKYPQTKEGTDETPIEWLVLDVQPGKALLVSKYGLDAKPYNKICTDVTWETCTLRTWLNKDFLNKAFTAEEQKAILTMTVDNSQSQCYSGWDTTGGNNTQDKIFLLSYAEANKYFNVEHYSKKGAKDNVKSRVEPTAYAIKQGAYSNSDYKTADGAASGWWWLRSPGRLRSSAAYVGPKDALDSSSVSNDNNDGEVVRPALWLNLESEIFQS